MSKGYVSTRPYTFAYIIEGAITWEGISLQDAREEAEHAIRSTINDRCISVTLEDITEEAA